MGLHKITGSIVPYFFNINPSSLSPKPKFKDQYEKWAKVFRFETKPNKDVYKQKILNLENKEIPIIEYINSQLNKNFKWHNVDVFDVFINEPNLGGVPDGEEAIGNKVINTLEIKTTIFEEDNFYPSKPYINHQLQLSLYMSLRGIDTGYLCLCRYPKYTKKTEKLNPTGSLTKKEIDDSWKEEKIVCWLSNKEYTYKYRILEHWDNNGLPSDKISLFKIQIDKDYFLSMMREISDYLSCLKYSKSPEMNEKQIEEIINYIEKVDII